MTGKFQSGIDHLYHIDTFLVSMTDLDELLSVIIREATLAVGSESCSLALYDADADELAFCVALGERGERNFEHELTRIRLPMGVGVIGYCARYRTPVNIQDAYEDPRFDPEVDRKTGFRTRSILAVPMVRQDRLIGVVEAVNKQDEPRFTERDEHMLAVLAAQAALVIENARLIDKNLRQEKLAALGQGISGAAHCIKNILNGVSGGEYILEVGIRRGDMRKVEQGWEILARNTGLMKDLVLDMLSYSRPREPEFELADVNEICNGVAELLEERALARGVEIVPVLSPEIVLTAFDPREIYRCVLNLVGNAIEAAEGDDSHVRIVTCCRPAEQVIDIGVEDNGCGISEEDLPRVFDAFFSTKGSRGTGLGLSVTRKIIREHGGEITVESEEGVGTQFTITLPLRGMQ